MGLFGSMYLICIWNVSIEYVSKKFYLHCNLLSLRRCSMEFEWSVQKNTANKKKHGVSFENAVLVFGDPMRLDVLDVEHSTIG